MGRSTGIEGLEREIPLIYQRAGAIVPVSPKKGFDMTDPTQQETYDRTEPFGAKPGNKPPLLDYRKLIESPTGELTRIFGLRKDRYAAHGVGYSLVGKNSVGASGVTGDMQKESRPTTKASRLFSGS
jgi:hypothetical protein